MHDPCQSCRKLKKFQMSLFSGRMSIAPPGRPHRPHHNARHRKGETVISHGKEWPENIVFPDEKGPFTRSVKPLSHHCDDRSACGQTFWGGGEDGADGLTHPCQGQCRDTPGLRCWIPVRTPRRWREVLGGPVCCWGTRMIAGSRRCRDPAAGGSSGMGDCRRKVGQ